MVGSGAPQDATGLASDQVFAFELRSAVLVAVKPNGTGFFTEETLAPGHCFYFTTVEVRLQFLLVEVVVSRYVCVVWHVFTNVLTLRGRF